MPNHLNINLNSKEASTAMIQLQGTYVLPRADNDHGE